ncbi:G-protein coupled receptor Mth2 [Musca domestica]|uniref:G-protein coupled receptor Mth2 n=1 Tax=Musca domestica TaxID=7370 RepID=A0ABM3V9F0_MUSDO|nr:G-protein coupled receptor Mth2 [Musca domestica]XP_058982402.1 G-protein coupled receptor Mth2 [Musca domestica]XP_058982404.1 G-protein coupled receptor Mth2 [Musca domestica]XP_058982405.1 G-protein coupled receptor Mth2 [Musca domestica]XP_058982406.1 G-protein coupled receptor Mth2 [Musca domestica]XP_058982407.1 G-protein coupled receptor Mth2 [Musca domestica]XP_058982408.1 G-protein coupled receptor Mth2 [Musca domestica]XP_058982409.1 G-protein coupled receptor Mth2 [Musca domest
MNPKNKISSLPLLALLYVVHTSSADTINSCKFEDTIDLRLAHRFPNGSYLYESKIFIPAKQVVMYDYEEVADDGKRIPIEPHARACICDGENNCLQFCCQQSTGMYITNPNIGCETNGLEDFELFSDKPCQNLNSMNMEWNLYANGTLSIQNGETLLSPQDYCLMLTPKKSGIDMILTPMLCLTINNEEISRDVVIINLFSPVGGILMYIYMAIQRVRKIERSLLLYTIFGSIFQWLVETYNSTIPPCLCLLLGYGGYFFQTVQHSWLNVIYFNLYQRRVATARTSQTDDKRFAVYAVGIPMGLTIILLTLDYLNISSEFKSGISGDFCWISPYNWPSLIFSSGLNATLLCPDYYYLVTVFRTLKTEKKLSPPTESYYFYAYLLFAVTICCLIELIANITLIYDSPSANWLVDLSRLFNGPPVIVIFLLFGLKWRHRCDRYFPEDYHTNAAAMEMGDILPVQHNC